MQTKTQISLHEKIQGNGEFYNKRRRKQEKILDELDSCLFAWEYISLELALK